MLKSDSIPNKRGWLGSPPPSGDQIGAKHSPLLEKYVFQTHTNLPAFFHPLASSMSFSTLTSSFDLQPQGLIL